MTLYVYALFLQKGGKIAWNHEIFSVPIYLYNNNTKDKQMSLEFVCIIFLAINILSELYGKLILLSDYVMSRFQ